MSLVLIACVVAAAQGGEPAPDARFMQVARYGAASATVDAQAAGGYGTSDNQPKPVRDARLLVDGSKAVLEKSGKGLSLTLANGSKGELWFRAADGNLLGYLEAQDARGVFRPVQYHPWSTCGNSYHRVALPPRNGWTFAIALGTGAQKTVVRWRYRHQGTDLVSNEVPWAIPPTLFDLEPRLRAEHELWLDGDVPVLGLKGIR